MTLFDLAKKDVTLNLRVTEVDAKIAEVNSKIRTDSVGSVSGLVSERLQLEAERNALLKTIADTRRSEREAAKQGRSLTDGCMPKAKSRDTPNENDAK